MFAEAEGVRTKGWSCSRTGIHRHRFREPFNPPRHLLVLSLYPVSGRIVYRGRELLVDDVFAMFFEEQ